LNDSTWDDVALFVGEYMDSRRAGWAKAGAGSDLLQQIAEAYIESRGLPRSALSTVVPMVDSVL
jgi:hypothetical protein